MAYDINIDEAKAKIWIHDVTTEITNVRSVLAKVSQASLTAPGEDDVIMQGIESTCKTLSDFWTKMCDGFEKTSGILGDIAEKIGQTGQSVVDDINTVRSNIGT